MKCQELQKFDETFSFVSIQSLDDHSKFDTLSVSMQKYAFQPVEEIPCITFNVSFETFQIYVGSSNSKRSRFSLWIFDLVFSSCALMKSCWIWEVFWMRMKSKVFSELRRSGWGIHCFLSTVFHAQHHFSVLYVVLLIFVPIKNNLLLRVESSNLNGFFHQFPSPKPTFQSAIEYRCAFSIVRDDLFSAQLAARIISDRRLLLSARNFGPGTSGFCPVVNWCPAFCSFLERPPSSIASVYEVRHRSLIFFSAEFGFLDRLGLVR